VTAGGTGPSATVRILSAAPAEGGFALDRLRDPETGARLAPVRADHDPVVGLLEGQTAPLLAIVDTGLDSSHPWIAQTLIDSVDLTGQGEEDRNGHGTWVAIRAVWDHPMPVGLLNVKAVGDDGTGTVDALARGIRWAARRGATVINVSAGVSQPSCQADCPLCRAALAAADGAWVSAAAGNVAGETSCPAKAGLLHPGRGVSARGVTTESMDTWGTRMLPTSYSGVGNMYGVQHQMLLLPIPPTGGEPASWDPRYRVGAADALIYRALELSAYGVRDEAVRWFDEVVARYGDDDDPDVRAYAALALRDKGFMFRQVGRRQDELACYNSAIERYGADPAEVVRDQAAEARLMRAATHQQLGDIGKALADYKAVIGDDHPPPGTTPSKPAAHALLMRGVLQRTLGRQKEAAADFDTARDWYEKDAQAGHVDAMNNLGVLLQDAEPAAARRWYEKAAQTGHVDAMNNLGVLLKDSEPAAARRWYEKAAQTGHVDAMNNLGVLLKDSEPAAAQSWYEKAAEAGNTDAMNNLGILLLGSDREAARGWFEKAARAGHVGAMNNLGVLLAGE
jgi:TPR repeat protein